VTSAPVGSQPSSRSPARPRRLITTLPVRCPQCGVTLRTATVEHEQTLVLACCCPRCDGALSTGTDRERGSGREPEPAAQFG